MNNFEKITTNANELATAIMGTDVIYDIQKRTFYEYLEERFDYNETKKRNIKYFKQWLESEVIE